MSDSTSARVRSTREYVSSARASSARSAPPNTARSTKCHWQRNDLAPHQLHEHASGSYVTRFASGRSDVAAVPMAA